MSDPISGSGSGSGGGGTNVIPNIPIPPGKGSAKDLKIQRAATPDDRVEVARQLTDLVRAKSTAPAVSVPGLRALAAQYGIVVGNETTLEEVAKALGKVLVKQVAQQQAAPLIKDILAILKNLPAPTKAVLATMLAGGVAAADPKLAGSLAAQLFSSLAPFKLGAWNVKLTYDNKTNRIAAEVVIPIGNGKTNSVAVNPTGITATITGNGLTWQFGVNGQGPFGAVSLTKTF